MQGICTVLRLLSNSLAVTNLTNKDMGDSGTQISCPISPQLQVQVLWTQPQRLKGRLTWLFDGLCSLFYSHYQFAFCFSLNPSTFLYQDQGSELFLSLQERESFAGACGHGNVQNK